MTSPSVSPDSCNLDVSVRTPLTVDDDSAGEVLRHRVRVIPALQDGDDGLDAGQFEVWKFDVATYQERCKGRVFDLFDDDSQTGASLYHWLFDPDTDSFKESLGEGCCYAGLLHFAWDEFRTELQGSRLMLAAAERTIQILGGGCGFVTLWPWKVPVPELSSLTANQLAEYWGHHEDVEGLWKAIGFARLAGTPLLIRDLTHRSPTVGDVLSGKRPSK